MKEHECEMSDEEMATDRWENKGGHAELAQHWAPQCRCHNQTETPSQRRPQTLNDKLVEITMQEHAGHSAEKLEESVMSEKSAVVRKDTHEEPTRFPAPRSDRASGCGARSAGQHRLRQGRQLYQVQDLRQPGVPPNGWPRALRSRHPGICERRTRTMVEHHEHMPGKSEHPKKPEQGKSSEKPQKARKSEQSDEPAHPDKARHQHKPGES